MAKPIRYPVRIALHMSEELRASLLSATRDGETEADAIRRAIREMTEREGK